MGTKSRNAKKSMNRGRGSSRGGRGRGGGHRGGRSGVPTSQGYATQQPTSFKYLDELYDDFKVYGHFGSESEDEKKKPKYRNNSKKPAPKKTSRPTTKGNLSQFAYRYKSDGDDDEEPAAVGLGFKSASTSTAASAKTMSSFGRSKYTKMMVFHKAATLLNDESEMSSEKEPEPMISGLLSPARSPESRAAIESIHASDENSTILQEEGSNESEIDNLLSNLTLQDPSLERVIKKLTRKERREKLYKELLDISDTDSDDEDDDEDDDLIDNTGDYENDFILSDEELVEDEDETAAMLDYIENAKLDDDGQIELRKYYQDLAQKLSAFDKKLANEESKERKAKGKARVKTSVDTKEAPVDTKKSKGKRVRAQADRPNGSSGNVHLDMGESEVLLEPYSDEELHIVTSAMSAARRSGYTDSEGSESEVNGSEDGDNEDLESEDIEIDDDGNEGDLFEEALSEEESDAEEEEIDDDLYEEDEDDSEAIDFESEDDEEDEEDYLASENDDDEPLIYEEEEVSIIVEAVPPSLQRGYNAISKYSASEARQRRMLKTEAFDLSTSPQLTDKQRRKLEKKEERSRKNEKKMSSRQQKKMMKEMEEIKLQQFIRDDSISSFQMAPMAKHTRRQLHLLATAYNLKSKSIGSGQSRSPVLSKTERTFIPTDRRYIERFISEAQSTLNATSSILSKHRMSNNRSPGYPKRKGAGKKESKGSPTVQSGPSHGYVVASDAAPISDQNRGHQMLAAMGWRQGDSLGAEGTGIVAPIEAIVRKKRVGLGILPVLQSMKMLGCLPRIEASPQVQVHHLQALWEIVVENAAETGDYSDFLSQLPENEPRYAIYDFEYEKPGEGLRSKIVFYAWTPDTSKVRAKMLYASSKDALRRTLVGIAIEVQGTDLSEVDEEAVLEKAQRSN
ncbi:unnamed protein product [Umbelopsis vinacea]